MLVDEIIKEPYDEFAYAIRYQKSLAQGDYITANTLSATRLSDSVDISATFLASTTGVTPSGTATGGSTTSIINTAVDHAASGFEVGDYVTNQTLGWTALIVQIKKTTNKNDTLVIKEQASAAANGNVYSALKCIASLKAGSDGNRVKVIFRVTTNLTRKFEDELIVNVKDY